MSQGSDQSSFVPDAQSAIFQSTRSIIGIGHGPQSIQGIYASTNTNIPSAQLQRTLSNEGPSVEGRQTAAPFIETKEYSQRGPPPNRGQNPGQGLLKTSTTKQSIVDTLTNPFARQYPRPSVPTVAPDINDNDVPSKHQNGGMYQNSPNVLTRRGSSGFHGIGGMQYFVYSVIYSHELDDPLSFPVMSATFKLSLIIWCCSMSRNMKPFEFPQTVY